ncbi:MAG: flagellar filament capping protein FliD [Bryobacterales bacterium]|nr:flagellar filament capping protein FliD [Bryobacterales bacterium]
MSLTGASSIFSGSSRYSNDFQQIVDRAVAIASLPKAQMENTRSEMSARSSALDSVQSKFGALRAALQNLESAREGYSTTTSNGAVASANVTGGAIAGIYQIEVLDLGSYTSSMSKDGLEQVADPRKESISSAASFTLTVDGEEFEITPAGTSLVELAEAINSSKAEVEATVVNIGTASAPDYRLSLRSTALGGVEIQLNDGTADLLDTTITGTPARYRVNGQPPAGISSNSRSVAVAPGLTVTLLKEGRTDISVSHNLASVTNAFSALASAFNAAVEELDKHRGEGAGALQGTSLVQTLAHSLRNIANYDSGAGEASSLSSLGVVFDKQGKLSLDLPTFSAATADRWEALAGFLGTSSTDGFLKHATALMDGLEGGGESILDTAIGSVKEEMARQNTRITEEQERIDQLEQNLLARMAAADAMIASLEQQVRYMTRLFESMQSLRESR